MKILSSAILACLLLALVACASEEKKKVDDKSLVAMLTSKPELVADNVFGGFRNGSMRALARRLSETEGMGASLAKELNRSRERYFNASEADKPKLLEAMKRDGIDAIVAGDEFSWRDGVTFRLFGSDGEGAEEMRTFFKGLGKHKAKGQVANGYLYVAENPAGGSLKMIVKKEMNGDKYFVYSIERDNGANKPREYAKGEEPRGTPKD